MQLGFFLARETKLTQLLASMAYHDIFFLKIGKVMAIVTIRFSNFSLRQTVFVHW